MARRRNELVGRARARSLRVAGGNALITNLLRGSATHDFGSLLDGAGESVAITVSGAALGDIAMASLGVSTVGMTVTANVTAENAVTVRVQNESGATVDLASTTVRVLVIRTLATS